MRIRNFILLFLCCVWICRTDASVDESNQTPASSADSLLILKRLDALEQRVATLESANTPFTSSENIDAKPVLEISSEEWCAPCQLAKREVGSVSDLPITLKYARWQGAPQTIPAFRYTDKNGVVRVRTGYSSGSWKNILAEMGFPR